MAEELDIINVEPADWNPIQSMIKVIGVGGAGCNAVNYMYNQKVQGCSFIVCNTDQQALDSSPIPVKIHLGREALGAGTDPTKGMNAALEAKEAIEKTVFTEGIKMLFITAGMGGGTGTGAAPVIAEMSRTRGVLTVAVVTVPSESDGPVTLSKAIDGIHELAKYVDSLIIINNEKLFDILGSKLIHEAYPKADEVLATAVKGITEIISRHGYINVDFEDVKTMMTNSGMALMGVGKGTGENRIEDAVKDALESPLLNDFDLKTAKELLVNITCGENNSSLTMDDLKKINTLISEYTGNANMFKTGIVYDTTPDYGDRIEITAIATGFKINDLSKIAKKDLGNTIRITKNFKHEKSQVTEEESNGILQERNSKNVKTIGPSQENKSLKPIGKKPMLLVEEGENWSALESETAIRRAERLKSENSEV
jgi:cell division protein FtsZ